MKKYWLWFPGDFEVHQGMLQNFNREERGMDWPAYWYIDDNYKNIKFFREYDLDSPTEFRVITHQKGYITINNKKYKINENISLPQGHFEITIYVFSADQLPSIYIEGEIISSDSKWLASNYIEQRPVGYSNLFTSMRDDPEKIPYNFRKHSPRSICAKDNGILIDFGEELNAKLIFQNLEQPITVCYGESEIEALDIVNCYYQQENVDNDIELPKRAFRYIFIPECDQLDLEVSAISVFLPMKNKSEFSSNDEELNKIWDVSLRTFELCSDLFFIDGIKRDRWIWGGDAYQDNFINQYSFFNEDIDKRTILALRGHDPIRQHLNTIVDYSLLWVISIYNHYQMTNDKEFVATIMPQMESMMQYLLRQTNELGFIYGRDGDWIFIDWSEIDKEGTVSGEQMFLIQALKSIITCKRVLHEPTDKYEKLYKQLMDRTIKYFWDDDKGAFIDSYESGKKQVTRHANILAVLFDIADESKKQKILKNVLLNDQITQITTPYFKFFEQDALCQLGQLPQVMNTIKSYWGSMINRGATTIWEEYNPEVDGKEQYEMYGDPFGKSLCHAWGASPIYLLGRYFFGLKPTNPGYETFEISPNLDGFEEIKCTLPIKNGKVNFNLNDGYLVISSNREGGIIRWQEEKIILTKDHAISLKLH